MSIEKSQQIKNLAEQKNSSGNEEEKSFWKKSKELLSQKEIYKQLFKTGVGSFASIKGVKSFYDVPMYFGQKFKAYGDKKEFKEIMGDLNKEGIDKEDIEDKKVGEIVNLEIVDEMQNKIEKLDVNEEIKNKLTEELNGLIENYHDEMESLEAKENEELKDILDEYIKTKITGVQASKETLNSIFVGSAVASPALAPAAYLSRSISYGFMDGVDRYLRLRRSAKEQAKRLQRNAKRKGEDINIIEEDVEIMKDVIIDGIKETYQEAFLKNNTETKKAGKQKAMDFIKAWGRIARYTFIGAKVELNSENLEKSFNEALNAFEGKKDFGEIANNFEENIKGIASRYWDIVKKPFNWFDNDTEKSGEAGGEEELEAVNATNATAGGSDNESKIDNFKITKLIPEDATEDSTAISDVDLGDEILWKELIKTEPVLAGKWGKFLDEHPEYLSVYKNVLDGLSTKEKSGFKEMLNEMKNVGIKEMDARAIFAGSKVTGDSTAITIFINENFNDIADAGEGVEIDEREKNGKSVAPQESSEKFPESVEHGLNLSQEALKKKFDEVVNSYFKKNDISDPSKLSKEQFSEILKKLEEKKIDHYSALGFLQDKLGVDFTEERGLKNEFTLKLGQDKIPAQLERVFHMMSVNSMKDIMGDDEIFGEEEGAKSLNVAANLVELAQNHNVAGVSANEFKEAVEWNVDTNELIIKDHAKFNAIVGELNAHAQKLWNDEILQKGAVAYLDDIEKGTWGDIIKANGLEEQVEGHDEITSEKIMDFDDKNKMIEEAKKLVKEAGTVESTPQTTETDATGAEDSEDKLEDFKNLDILEQRKAIDDLHNQSREVDKITNASEDAKDSFRKERAEANILKTEFIKEFNKQHQAEIKEYKNLGVEIKELEIKAEVEVNKNLEEAGKKIYRKPIIGRIFGADWDEAKWKKAKELDMNDVLNGKHNNVANEKLLSHLKKIKNSFGNPSEKETVGKYLERFEDEEAEKNLGLHYKKEKFEKLGEMVGANNEDVDIDTDKKSEGSGKRIISEDVPGIL